MDDITHGQWSKNYHNDNDENHIHNIQTSNDDLLDPYTMQSLLEKLKQAIKKTLERACKVLCKFCSEC